MSDAAPSAAPFLPSSATFVTNTNPSQPLQEQPRFGAIPAELGNLPALERLSLSRNQFTGPIPAELGKLSTLESLSLFQNSLSGAIPPELGNLNSWSICA